MEYRQELLLPGLLSALGSSERSGRDWSTDAKGAGLTVNTQGKGGGKNTQGLGTLQGGKVGTGGVGLIEDESEVVGGLDRDIIAQYIKTQLGQILYCYERQLMLSQIFLAKSLYVLK